jgi:tetratricopeptide (TPR) repeat protein
MAEGRPSVRLIAAVALCLVLALGGQAMADSLVPDASGADTNRAVGRAAASYLTGIKTYAAAALWNRIDPLMHSYYTASTLGDQRYMLTTIAAVQALDAHFIDSYYVGSWILADNDRVDEAIEMAERGVEENPGSGLLLANLAQIRLLFDDDLPGALEAALLGMGDDIVWTDLEEEHAALPIFGAVFRAAGRDDLYNVVQAELERIDVEAGDSIAPEEHDHDRDGVPDH